MTAEHAEHSIGRWDPARRIENRIGERFAKLVILGRAPTIDRRGRILVRCDCGEEKVIWASNWRQVKSCGCERRKNAGIDRMAGLRFERLAVLRSWREPGATVRTCFVRCDCGTEKTVHESNLRSGATRSCGCLLDEVRRQKDPNAVYRHPLYQTWRSMRDRCENQNAPAFKYYGAKGVNICERWRQDFWAFVADMGPKPTPEHSIDRIDPRGNYEPANTRWADRATQAKNRSNNVFITYQGRTMTCSDWGRELGISRERIRQKLEKGLPVEEVLAPPKTIPSDAQRDAMSRAARRRWAGLPPLRERKSPARRKRYTRIAPGLHDRILQLHSQGLSTREIAAEVGVSVGSVYVRTRFAAANSATPYAYAIEP